MRLRPAPLPLIALVIALAATLGGCGGSTTAVDDLPADAVFLTAVDRSTDISTVRVEYETTTSRDGEVIYTSRGEGVLAPGAISFTSTMSQFAGESEVSGDHSIEMRFVDGVAYIRIPGLPDMPEEDVRTWIVLDDDDADGTTAQLDQLDFGATLQALRDSAEVTEDGRETIAGVATTRYVGTTTLRSLHLAEGRTEEQLEQLEQLNGDDANLDDDMPLTVWIDDEGLIRRFDYITGHDGFEITQSMTVLEYGLEVDITAPPAEETMSMEEFEAFQEEHAESFGSGFEFEGSEEIVIESESSSTGTATSEGSATGTVTTERSATAESAPAPTSTIDSGG